MTQIEYDNKCKRLEIENEQIRKRIKQIAKIYNKNADRLEVLQATNEKLQAKLKLLLKYNSC